MWERPVSGEDLRPLAIWQYELCPMQELGSADQPADPDRFRYRLVRYLINLLATDLMENTAAELKRQSIGSLESLRRAETPLGHYSESVSRRFLELKDFLFHNLYHHAQLEKLGKQSKDLIRFLFDRLVAEPALLPQRYQDMTESAQVQTVVADYIAGMTDRFAERTARELA